eukprot:scaffold23131_cov61-Phaeocystis_antarctica.AAC.2
MAAAAARWALGAADTRKMPKKASRKLVPTDRLRRPPRLPAPERDEPPNAASIEDCAVPLRRPGLLLRLLFLAALCSRHERCSWRTW